jgi:protein phosphatase
MGVVDTWVFPPYPGEVFVICSDGLSNELTREQIEAVLAEHPDAQEAAAELVRRGVEAGGHDNVTAIVVAVQGQDSDSDVDEDTTPRENVNGSSGESRS